MLHQTKTMREGGDVMVSSHLPTIGALFDPTEVAIQSYFLISITRINADLSNEYQRSVNVKVLLQY